MIEGLPAFVHQIADPPPDVWVHPGVAIGPSSIAGAGLVAGVGLDAGIVVIRLGGRLVTSTELDALLVHQPDGYVDTITVADDRHLVLPPGTLAHWANHSCDPNLWHAGPYEIVTRRPVRPGDELTLDYGTNSGAPGFRMRCTCGSPMCRAVVTSEDWRRPDLQDRYGGHWTPALRARIVRRGL